MACLFIPFVMLLLFLCVVVLLFAKKFRVASALFMLLLVVNLFFHCVAINVVDVFRQPTADNIRFLSFNVDLTTPDSSSDVLGIYKQILAVDADVVFLTEMNVEKCYALDSLLNVEYEYREDPKNSQCGNVLYSRFPIRDCVSWYKKSSLRMFALSATIELDNHNIDICGCHLYSNNKSVGQANKIKDIHGAKAYLKNYRRMSLERVKEAQTIVDSLSDVPALVLGDMNDVPGSPALKTLERAGLKNAWWKGGFGYGATLHKPLPYRIDHIYYSDGLKLQRIRRVKSHGLSDHDALVADFVLE